MSNMTCASCGHGIDDSAKICPYCGAHPNTGEKIDTQAILEEVFRPRQLTTSETVLEYARHRQGFVIAAAIVVGFLVLAALHQIVTARNAAAVSAQPAVPLTEITDVTTDTADMKAQPLPKLDFPYQGDPRAMRTYIAETGAVTPPEVVAEQQAMAQASQTAGARNAPGTPVVPQAGQPRAVVPAPQSRTLPPPQPRPVQPPPQTRTR